MARMEWRADIPKSKYPIMACGHFAFTHTSKYFACAICGTKEIMENPPSLEGRQAKCSDRCAIKESHWRLPFFKSTPDKEYDEYYCGHGGWD